MAKVLVFQHVPAEPLGTLDPMLRDLGHRIRYINFHRDPDAQPDVSRYDALIILGGPQNPDQGNLYPHLLQEMRCIEEALKRDLPVLGICLGAQLLAYTLGGGVRAMDEWEIGWYKLMPTKQAATDPLFCTMKEPQPVFQWHGYTFDLPHGATRLAQSKACKNQAFRYGQHAYGFQFHLELDERLINRWLSMPEYLQDIEENCRHDDDATIRHQTHNLIDYSIVLSQDIFSRFLKPLGERNRRHVLPSR